MSSMDQSKAINHTNEILLLHSKDCRPFATLSPLIAMRLCWMDFFLLKFLVENLLFCHKMYIRDDDDYFIRSPQIEIVDRSTFTIGPFAIDGVHHVGRWK